MIDKRYYGEFAKFFNTTTLAELSRFGRSSFISYVIKNSGFDKNVNLEMTFSDLFDQVYNLLFSEYRCEYIYKNSIVNQVLIGNHSESHSTLFSEFRAGFSKADVLILNGTSSIYEIKTELDNFERLPSQLASYFQMFDTVNVISHEGALDKIKNIVDERVGLMTLSEKGEIETKRVAITNKENVDPAVIFDSLRMPEYKLAVKMNFGFVPDVPNTKIYRECKKLFTQLSPEQAHKTMVEVLKTRKQSFIKQLIKELPDSLKMTCLNSTLTKKQWVAFKEVLRKDYLAA